MSIYPTIRARINGILRDIEREEDVRFLFAVESGSRAWGYPSPDSDYDVRFVYARPLDWYLSLEPGRDVIERPIDTGMDMSGWDVKKALHLLLKPNIVLLEWLDSPIRYRWDGNVCTGLRTLAEKVAYGPAGLHHYLHLARKQWHKHIDGKEEINLKHYLYAVRPVLALNWMRRYPDPDLPPCIDFKSMRDLADLPDTLDAALDRLLMLKSSASGSGSVARIAALDDFILSELALATEAAKTTPKPGADLRADADTLFRAIVKGEAARTEC